MKYNSIIAICMGAMFFIACAGSESSPSYIPGYWSPGDFRPMGVYSSKHYSLFGGMRSCAADARCNVVYNKWITAEDNKYSEGIGVNDKHLANPTFSMKITRILGFPLWQVNIIIDGVSYSALVPESAITVGVQTPSSDPTTPAYGSLSASTAFLNYRTITFNNSFDVPNGSGGIVTISPGDTIVAADYSYF
jgi:hypothetical protein